MGVEHLNPDGVAAIDNVSHVSVATGSKIIFFRWPSRAPLGRCTGPVMTSAPRRARRCTICRSSRTQ